MWSLGVCMHVCIGDELLGSKVERKSIEIITTVALTLILALYRSASAKKMTTAASALNLDFWRSASARKIHLYSFSAHRQFWALSATPENQKTLFLSI